MILPILFFPPFSLYSIYSPYETYSPPRTVLIHRKNSPSRTVVGAETEILNKVLQARLSKTHDYLQRNNLERCTFIIRKRDNDKDARRQADDWTNVRTIDEKHVNSSWENCSLGL